LGSLRKYNYLMAKSTKNKTPLHHPERRAAPRKQVPFHRVNAEIRTEATKEVTASRVFLIDLTPSGVGAFTVSPLDKGELVSIVISQPKHLYVKGEVMWCSPYNFNIKIISPEVFRYRVGIKFRFDSPQEQDTVRNYCDELHTEE